MPRIFDVKIIRTDDGPRWEPDRSLGFWWAQRFSKMVKDLLGVKRVWLQILLIAFHLAAAFGFSVE